MARRLNGAAAEALGAQRIQYLRAKITGKVWPVLDTALLQLSQRVPYNRKLSVSK